MQYVICRNPTPNGETPPNSEDSMIWKKSSVEERNYFFLNNDVTEPRKDLRSKEASFWNNYLNHIARDGPLHHPWQWDGDDMSPLADNKGKISYSCTSEDKNNHYYQELLKIVQLDI